MCWQCRILKCFPPPLYRSASGNGSRPLPPVARGRLFALHIKNCCLRFLRGRHKDGKSDLLNALKKTTTKKNQALNSLLYLSARCPSGGRRHASLSLPHAFIPISGCLWQGKLSAGVDFVFLQKKKNKQSKQKTSFCYGPSGLNATPRGKLRKNGNSWTTFWSNCSPCRPLQTLSAAIFSLSFL